MNRRILSPTNTLSLSLLLFLSGQGALATDTINATVGVTVDATIAISQTTGMRFGNFFMTGNDSSETGGDGALAAARQAGDSAYLQLNWDDTVDAVDGLTARASTVGGTVGPAVFSISGAAFNSPVRLTAPELIDTDSTAGTQDVTSLGGLSHVMKFTDLELDTDGIDDAENNTGAGDTDAATVHAVTDASGNLTVRAIGRLYSTDLGTDNLLYEGGAYTGSYTLTVSY